jgi:hypothetical protein
MRDYGSYCIKSRVDTFPMTAHALEGCMVALGKSVDVNTVERYLSGPWSYVVGTGGNARDITQTRLIIRILWGIANFYGT